MFKRILLFVVLSVFVSSVYAQNQQPAFASNPSLSFEKYLKGVKYAEIGLNVLNQEEVDKGEGIAGFYYLAQKYLQNIGFEYVALTSTEKTQLDLEVQSYCEYSMVMFGADIDKNSISNLTISFVSCNGDIFSFRSEKKFNYGKFTDVEKKLLEHWTQILKSKGEYTRANQLQLPVNLTPYSKENLIDYFAKNKANLAPIEGIYERVRLSFEDIAGGKYTIGIIKNQEEEGYIAIYLSGAQNVADWKAGEIKALIYKTATADFFTVDWISRDKSVYDDVYGNLTPLGLNVYSSGVFPISYKFIKTLPAK